VNRRNKLKLIEIIGTPFVDGGRTFGPNGGMDCWGVYLEVMRRIGYDNIPDYRISAFETLEIYQEFQRSIDNGWQRIVEPEYAAMITFKFSPVDKDAVHHMGLYLGDNDFIHALKKRGCVITKFSKFWRQRVEGYYRWTR
jgi:cell wall-associated NlpC family hydrolase